MRIAGSLRRIPSSSLCLSGCRQPVQFLIFSVYHGMAKIAARFDEIFFGKCLVARLSQVVSLCSTLFKAARTRSKIRHVLS